ncbi:MAG: RsbRD N-terminal domain-containing protein [Armatimonadetes bacterium]|nr:RsbRD N-terminal domain-containing protein [Armatimonadota bacterium]
MSDATQSPSEAAARLTQLIPEILRQWESIVRSEISPARDEDRPQLLDSLPQFLMRLVEDLEANDPQRDPIDVVKAREHGEQRARLDGYTLQQVIREYHLLRRVLSDLLESQRPLSRDADRIVQGAIDLAVQKASAQFVESLAQRREE